MNRAHGRKHSAGLLPFRRAKGTAEVFLVHPGGPFWARKDEGAWSIPKGEFAEDEDPLEAARREFAEETGFALQGEFVPLGELKQAGGKRVTAWAVETTFDAAAMRSNLFSMEWPPKSGKMREFPEVDRGGWFLPEEATRKILKSQAPFLEALWERLRL